MAIIFGAGAAPSNFTVAVTVPAVAGIDRRARRARPAAAWSCRRTRVEIDEQPQQQPPA